MENTRFFVHKQCPASAEHTLKFYINNKINMILKFCAIFISIIILFIRVSKLMLEEKLHCSLTQYICQRRRPYIISASASLSRQIAPINFSQRLYSRKNISIVSVLTTSCLCPLSSRYLNTKFIYDIITNVHGRISHGVSQWTRKMQMKKQEKLRNRVSSSAVESSIIQYAFQFFMEIFARAPFLLCRIKVCPHVLIVPEGLI